MGSYIAEYYKMGLYNKQDLDLFVSVGMLTEEEKQKILGA
ncbi:XkdX family protein [Clostridium cadaveris]|nr:XkdX family protein [Clostridium cadaveris]NME66025.1 XkdX family protein [Clostridium cadaveris]